MNGFLDQFTGYFQHYGYWTIAAALLLENAGIPVPGETILIAASVLAQTHGTLRLPRHYPGRDHRSHGRGQSRLRAREMGRPAAARAIPAGPFACAPGALARGERLFARYGPATIYFARFIVGLRVFAGPLAGALRMHWRRFAIFNALGAATWVTVVASVSYTFGQHVPALVRTMRAANLILLAIAIVLLVFFGKRLLARVGPEE